VSYTVETTIRCDGEDETGGTWPQTFRCREGLRWRTENKSGISPTHAADLAESKGWWARSSGLNHSTPKVAYCPRHRPDKEETK
jgi:hypothetical protein